MFDSPLFAAKDEDEMEDFHDYEDEEHEELTSKLDEYEEDEEEEEEEVEVAIIVSPPVAEPAPAPVEEAAVKPGPPCLRRKSR